MTTYFQQESERLYYRKLTIEDISTWTEFFVDNDRIHFLGLDPTKPPKELATLWMNMQLERYAEGKRAMLAAIEKKSGAFIGQCGLLAREMEGKPEVEIAYSLKPKFWKQGYGTEMAQQMRKFGRENQLAPRFISIIHKENHDSMHVAEKNGMQVLFESKFMGMEVYVYGTKTP